MSDKKPPSAKVLRELKIQAGIIAALTTVNLGAVMPALISARDSILVVVGVLLLTANVAAIGWIARKTQQTI